MTHRVWLHDYLQKLDMSQKTFLIFLAALVGAIGGGLAVVFRIITDFLGAHIFGRGGGVLEMISPLAVPLVPMVGGLLVSMVIYFGDHRASGHGIPEAIQAVALRGGRMRGKTILSEGLASIISIASGGSVGRVGPVVEIGAGVGSLIGQFFDEPDQTVKLLLGCGAGAAIAAIFNAPIAGVFFALEIILGEFTTGNFSMLVIAAVSGDLVARTVFGDQPALLIEHIHASNSLELIAFIGLGFLAAVVGSIFIWFLYFTEDQFKRIMMLPGWFRPALGGFFVGLIGLLVPQVFGSGFDVIHQILDGSYGIKALFAILILKLLATSISLGSGMSGGIFAPTLLIGASLGGLYGLMMDSIFQSWVVGDLAIYILVGMATMISCVNNAPITAVMMLFEMTRNYDIFLPVLATAVLANLIARMLIKENIHLKKLRRRGLIIHEGYDMSLLMQIRVKRVMDRKIPVLREDDRIDVFIKKIRETRRNGLPVVNEAGEMVGMITQHDIYRSGEELDLAQTKINDLMTSSVKVVFADETLDQVLFYLMEYNISQMPVVDRQHPKIVLGIVYRADIISFYQRNLFRAN